MTKSQSRAAKITEHRARFERFLNEMSALKETTSMFIENIESDEEGENDPVIVQHRQARFVELNFLKAQVKSDARKWGKKIKKNPRFLEEVVKGFGADCSWIFKSDDSAHKKCSIFHGSNQSAPLFELGKWFGDSTLTKMSLESKTHLLAILAQWQAVKLNKEDYGMGEAFYGYAFYDHLLNEVLSAIASLEDLNDEDCCHLMTALALQIKHGIYQD